MWISSQYKANIDSSLQVVDNSSSTQNGNMYIHNPFMETRIWKWKNEAGIGSSAADNYGIIIHSLGSDMVGLRVAMWWGAAKAAIFEGGKVGIGTNTPTSTLTVSGDIETTTGRKIKTNTIQMVDPNTQLTACNAGAYGEIIYTSDQVCPWAQPDYWCLVYCTKTSVGAYIWRVLSHQ